MAAVLERVNNPSDVRRLSIEECRALAAEVRDLIIRTVSRTGGHLAANLGTVELTIALLRVFAPPADRLLWDVSHQAYAYKILTGRRDLFGTLRQAGGISGFLRRSESEYDAFGAGHAGTALSAALGMAVARDRRGGAGHVVAVVGDAAIGCGSSFEALNNAASATRRLIVVLNDNKMSISANVGALSRHLARLLVNPRYNRWKARLERFAARTLGLGWLRNAYLRIEESMKGLFLRSSMFEEFGFRYLGPVDGHDIATLCAALEIARDSDEPILLHVATQKGRGYPQAEDEPEAWHGTGAFDPATGRSVRAHPGPTYSEVFGRALVRIAEDDGRIVAVTAAMTAGTGLAEFAARFPKRFFDVGIAEEHAAVFAAGLACEGFVPVVAVYSTFAQRMVDFVIHDICLQNLHVILCLDRAGVVGDDGPTHHGVFDIALLRAVPGIVIMEPRDEAELADMLWSSAKMRGPVAIRYPRGTGPGAGFPDNFKQIEPGCAEQVCAGRDGNIWALGSMFEVGRKVRSRLAEAGFDFGLVNPRSIKPLDGRLLDRHGAHPVVTIENAAARGGFGSAVAEHLAARGCPGPVLAFGWPDEFVGHGSAWELMLRHGLDETAIARAVLGALRGRARPPCGARNGH